MKKLLLLLPLALVLVLFSNCKKLEELTKFNISFNSEVTIPANSIINLPFDIFTPDITTNYQEQFSANKTRTDLVSEIKMDAVNITVKAPAGQNLDFLKSINIFIAAEGLDEKEIAFINDVPDGLTALSLECVSDNIKDYITKDKIKLRVKTVTDKTVSQNTELDVQTKFWVQAKIL